MDDNPQKRIVAPSWAKRLREVIDSKRGYQAEMARAIGVSESMINRIKSGKVIASEFVEAIAAYTGLPLPPLVVDEEQAEIIALAADLSPAQKKLAITMLRGLLDLK